MLRDGPRALSDADLVAVLFHPTCRLEGRASDLAHSLLRDLGGLAGLGEIDEHLVEREGIGPIRAAVLLAVREIAARLGRSKLRGREILGHPAAVAHYLTLRYR